MSVNRSLNFIYHEPRDRRGATGDQLGYLDGIPSSKWKKKAEVVCIGCVEFVSIKIHAGKSKRWLEISLVICRIVYEIECVTWIGTKWSRLSSWKSDHGVKIAAVLAWRSYISSVRDVELRSPSEHWKFKHHSGHCILEGIRTNSRNSTNLSITSILQSLVSDVIGSVKPQPDKVSLLYAIQTEVIF